MSDQEPELTLEKWEPTIDEIMAHRKELEKTNWKSDKFWTLPLNGFDPWKDDDGYFFEKETAIRVIEFWEDTFVHSSAEWFEEPFMLEPFQKQLVGHFFAWKHKKTKLRRFREVFFYVPRKNGKSLLAVCMALILYRFDGEMGAEVYLMAADKQQAGIAWNDAQFNVEHVEKFEDIRLYKSMKSMEHAETNSIARVMSADGDTKHGYRPSCYLIDELHLQKDENLMEVMETGTAARRQPAAFFMTTADYDQPSPCNEKLDYALRVRDGAISDPEFLPLVYMAEDSDDWEDEKTWIKANPNYGISCKKSYMAKKARKAKNNPRFLNTFKRLHLNIKTGQAVRWLSPDDWKACSNPAFPVEELLGTPCYGGIDLSSKYDLSSLVLYFPEYKYFLPFFWVPEDQVKQKLEYQIWEKAGLLIATKGNVIDYNFIQAKVIEMAEKYEIVEIGYDPFNASHFVMELSEYDNVPMAEFRQTMTYFNEPSKEFEKMILEHSLQHGNNEVFNWMAGNVEVKEDPEGNFRPVKPRRGVHAKVDGIISAVMALGVQMNDDLNTKFIDPVVSTAAKEIEAEAEADGQELEYSEQEILDDDDLW